MRKSILVTGGAGYVGSLLVPKLLNEGHEVTVLDLFLYSDNVFNNYMHDPFLKIIKGDIRDAKIFEHAIKGCDTVIHLACISNDPSFELNPDLGKTINFDCFLPMVKICKNHRINHFIYASSSSVYGVKDDDEVIEELSLEPLTDYSKYKALCEEILLKEQTPDFNVTILRPATVCGYAPRQRLDVIVNILTNHAFNKRKITIFGGEQKRPNITIKDMVRSYIHLLNVPIEKVNGKIYNVGFENHTVNELANMVKKNIGKDVLIETQPTNDMRSYHISSKKIKDETGFTTKFSIEDAINDLKYAMDSKVLANPMENEEYINIAVMKNKKLT